MTIRLDHEEGKSIRVFAGDALLCRYVYVSAQEAKESPRPYFHPLNSFAGDTLTNFRPNDHPWHHGLSFTLTNVSGHNFWGGPTCKAGEGYKHRDDHGSQRHVAWTSLKTEKNSAVLVHSLEWQSRAGILFRETREITIEVQAAARSWSLRWKSRLANVSGHDLSLGNPHSFGGLPGSHYTGLQFRGARELLDDHLDPTIRIVSEGGYEGDKAVHGTAAKWMEWHGQLDETLNRVTLRFENNTGPMHWFVRRNYPLAVFPVQFDRDLIVAANSVLEIDHTLTFTST
jgi:hypothetical protein